MTAPMLCSSSDKLKAPAGADNIIFPPFSSSTSTIARRKFLEIAFISLFIVISQIINDNTGEYIFKILKSIGIYRTFYIISSGAMNFAHVSMVWWFSRRFIACNASGD